MTNTTAATANMAIIDLQNASNSNNVPNEDSFRRWVDRVLEASHQLANSAEASIDTELTIRVVDNDEGQQLNQQYRQKDYPTNVLSFPFEQPPELTLPLLGDLVICADVVEREAKEQEKSHEAHWAHMVIHGVLHLLGFDHMNDLDAEVMESLEIEILTQLGYPNPYIVN